MMLRPYAYPRAAWLLAVVLALMPGLAAAAAHAYPSALSSRIVRFIANPNNTYVLYLHPGMVTDIKLARGEHLRALALGDTVQWITQQVKGSGDVFIKPARAGIKTSATLVTNHHTYQMMLVSREHGDWYQEVRFHARTPLVYAAPQLLGDPSAREQHNTVIHHRASKTKQHAPRPLPTAGEVSGSKTVQDRFSQLNLQSLRFGWRIKGKAPFRPQRVFSSPNFVWMQMPENAPEPVVFVRRGGSWGIINYTRRGDWIVVQGAPKVLELRAGGQAVRVYGPGAKTKASPSTSRSGSQSGPSGFVSNGGA